MFGKLLKLCFWRNAEASRKTDARGKTELPPGFKEMMEDYEKNYQPPDYPNPMIPPWEQYPHIPRFSIGWRMGPGEDYNLDFGDWFASLSSEDRAEYIVSNPEPIEWEGYYDLIVERRKNN